MNNYSQLLSRFSVLKALLFLGIFLYGTAATAGYYSPDKPMFIIAGNGLITLPTLYVYFEPKDRFTSSEKANFTQELDYAVNEWLTSPTVNVCGTDFALHTANGNGANIKELTSLQFGPADGGLLIYVTANKDSGNKSNVAAALGAVVINGDGTIWTQANVYDSQTASLLRRSGAEGLMYQFQAKTPGMVDRFFLAHEIGHLFGLLHDVNDENLMYPTTVSNALISRKYIGRIATTVNVCQVPGETAEVSVNLSSSDIMNMPMNQDPDCAGKVHGNTQTSTTSLKVADYPLVVETDPELPWLVEVPWVILIDQGTMSGAPVYEYQFNTDINLYGSFSAQNVPGTGTGNFDALWESYTCDTYVYVWGSNPYEPEEVIPYCNVVNPGTVMKGTNESEAVEISSIKGSFDVSLDERGDVSGRLMSFDIGEYQGNYTAPCYGCYDYWIYQIPVELFTQGYQCPSTQEEMAAAIYYEEEEDDTVMSMWPIQTGPGEVKYSSEMSLNAVTMQAVSYQQLSYVSSSGTPNETEHSAERNVTFQVSIPMVLMPKVEAQSKQ